MYLLNHLCRWFRQIFKDCLFRVIKGETLHDVGPKFSNLRRNGYHVEIINTRNNSYVDLGGNPGLLQPC